VLMEYGGKGNLPNKTQIIKQGVRRGMGWLRGHEITRNSRGKIYSGGWRLRLLVSPCIEECL